MNPFERDALLGSGVPGALQQLNRPNLNWPALEQGCRIALCAVLVERPVSPFFGITLRTGRKILTATSKISGDRAESIFSKTRTQSMSLNRIISEQDAVSDAREAKTARLRELRLEKQADDMAAAVVLAASPKRAGKR